MEINGALGYPSANGLRESDMEINGALGYHQRSIGVHSFKGGKKAPKWCCFPCGDPAVYGAR